MDFSTQKDEELEMIVINRIHADLLCNKRQRLVSRAIKSLSILPQGRSVTGITVSAFSSRLFGQAGGVTYSYPMSVFHQTQHLLKDELKSHFTDILTTKSDHTMCLTAVGTMGPREPVTYLKCYQMLESTWKSVLLNYTYKYPLADLSANDTPHI